MLRGFRWQLAALFLAAAVFAVSLITRIGPLPSPTPVPDDGSLTAVAVPSLTIESTATASATPAPLLTGVPTYREALVGTVGRLNPLLSPSNPVDKDITSLIFEGLMQVNAFGEAVPDLAAEMPVMSADGLEYVVRLREDVRWQDGEPFTADDVIYTMTLLSAPDFPGPAYLGRFWRTVETERLGPHLVRFRLTQPLGSFLDALTIGLLPVHALRGTTAAQIANHPFNLSPIGTGPYQLESLRYDGATIRRVDLRVAPNYRLRPEGQNGYALDRVSFLLYTDFAAALTALQTGEVHALAARSRSERPQLANLPNAVTTTTIEPTLGVLIFNWQRETTAFFQRERVRAALQMGLDRDSIIERQLADQAVLANSPLIPNSWAYNANVSWRDYDPEGALDLIAQEHARYLRGIDDDVPEVTPTPDGTSTPEPTALPANTYFQFSILTPDDPALIAVAQEIATQWAQLNLGVTVDPVDRATYEARLSAGDFDTALVDLPMGLSADPDVYGFWHQGAYPDGANYGGADSARISELLEVGRRETSGINRAVVYGQFQQEFVYRAIALPLYYPLYSYAMQPQVQGLQLGYISTPSDRFRTLQDWRLTAP